MEIAVHIQKRLGELPSFVSIWRRAWTAPAVLYRRGATRRVVLPCTLDHLLANLLLKLLRLTTYVLEFFKNQSKFLRRRVGHERNDASLDTRSGVFRGH